MAFTKKEFSFTNKKSDYYFDASIAYAEKLIPKENAIIITDENVYQYHQHRLEGWKTIVIKAGEEYKQQSTVDFIIGEMIKRKADRKSFVIGVGGGVVTDIAGYVAGIYMRGIAFGFVPTTILAMVDASVGGKNGIDVGVYKNIIGIIRQPDFLLYDYSFLETLPQQQWVNGFAEIIKHACIKDAELFSFLENHSLEDFQKNRVDLNYLIEKNVAIKTNIVLNDEFEKGDRKLLNFGHTLGHAIENEYKLLHGHAVSIGMVMAALFSEEMNNFYSEQKEKLLQLLKKYGLPTSIKYDTNRIMEIMQMDKKKENQTINYVLLNKIGEATVNAIPMSQLKYLINLYQ